MFQLQSDLYNNDKVIRVISTDKWIHIIITTDKMFHMITTRNMIHEVIINR